MTAMKTVSVNGTDLRLAFEFVSSCAPYECSAYIW
jgi:hypothetical protein